MKVLHFVNENILSWAGPWIQLLRYLEARGLENVILCNPGGTLPEKCRSEGLSVQEYKPFLPFFPTFTVGAADKIKKIKPDLIHTRLSSAAAIGGYWGQKLGIPVISTIDKYSKIKYTRYSNRAVAVSESIKTWMIDSGYPAWRISVIPNPVNVAEYLPNDEERKKIRAKLGVEDHEIVILGAGRFVEWKGFDVLLEAAGMLAQETPFRIWLAGDGPDMGRLKGIVSDNPVLSNKTTFLGFVDDIKPLLWGADLFVLPSREPEPFGLILIEGMSSGLPVVATAAGGPLDMVTQDSGWLVRPGKADELQSLLEKIIDRGILREKSRGAIERARTFDVKVAGESYFKLYEEVCQ